MSRIGPMSPAEKVGLLAIIFISIFLLLGIFKEQLGIDIPDWQDWKESHKSKPQTEEVYHRPRASLYADFSYSKAPAGMQPAGVVLLGETLRVRSCAPVYFSPAGAF